MMPRSSICIMDLSALQTIPFCTGIDSAACEFTQEWTGPHGYLDWPTATALAYAETRRTETR